MGALTKRNRDVTSANTPTPPKQADWAICDISGSMCCHVEGTDKSRIQCLNAALQELGDDVQVIAFNDTISREKIGEYTAGGGTNVVPALREVAKYEPSYIVLISDGGFHEPDRDVLSVVDKLRESAIIDTIYIGPDDSRAEACMRAIADVSGGRFRKYDASALTEKMQTLLPPPKETVSL